jgi:hypothetical protein
MTEAACAILQDDDSNDADAVGRCLRQMPLKNSLHTYPRMSDGGDADNNGLCPPLPFSDHRRDCDLVTVSSESRLQLEMNR